MPKTYLTERQREEAEAKRKDDALCELLGGRMSVQQMTNQELADRLRYHRNTITDYKRHGGRFTVNDIRSMVRIFKFSDEEILRFIR